MYPGCARHCKIHFKIYTQPIKGRSRTELASKGFFYRQQYGVHAHMAVYACPLLSRRLRCSTHVLTSSDCYWDDSAGQWRLWEKYGIFPRSVAGACTERSRQLSTTRIDEEMMAFVSGDAQGNLEQSWVWAGTDLGSSTSPQLSPRSTAQARGRLDDSKREGPHTAGSTEQDDATWDDWGKVEHLIDS